MIAADDEVVIKAPQRCMVGGVAIAKADLPAALAGDDRVAIRQAGEALGHRVDHIGKVEGTPGGAFGHQVGRGSGAAVEQQRFGGGQGLDIQHQHPGIKPCGAGDDQLDPSALEPTGKADMVGVMVGDDQSGDGFGVQRAAEQRFPQRDAPARHQAGVDDGPAVAIIQGIDVDMVQRHRQRQAHPEDVVGDAGGGAFGGRRFHWVMDAAHAVSASA